MASWAVPEPAGELLVSSPWSKTSIDGIERTSSLMLVAPVLAISLRVMISTGAGPSASVRLIAEPVISTRSSCCACGHAASGNAAATAAATIRRRPGRLRFGAAAWPVLDMLRS